MVLLYKVGFERQPEGHVADESRLKHVNLPWESYRAWSAATPSHSASFTPTSSSSSPSASSHSRSPTPHHARPKDPLAVLNNLAEAKKMMDAAGSSSTGGEGMSFSMLCRLISEGRADEVPVKQIPDQLNVSPLFKLSAHSLTLLRPPLPLIVSSLPP